MFVRGLVVALILWGAWNWWSGRPVETPPGVLVADLPRQSGTGGGAALARPGYRITPLADFSIEARVLGVKHYRHGREADLSPTDLALGWGPMSDSSVLDRIHVTQGNRFYYWQSPAYPIPRRDIERHSANMHMIPATEDIAEQLKSLRQGQVVAIEGHLVEVHAGDGWRWRSSLTRDDTGDGACELVWVADLRVVQGAYD